MFQNPDFGVIDPITQLFYDGLVTLALIVAGFFAVQIIVLWRRFQQIEREKIEARALDMTVQQYRRWKRQNGYH